MKVKESRNAMAIYQVFVVMMPFMCGLNSLVVEAQVETINEGCQAKCGTVKIPYPFGIGPDCYLEDSFEIVCRNVSGAKTPFLNQTNLEVREISIMDGTIEVEFPVIYMDCSNRPNNRIISLEGSPFVISKTRNTFTAVGCYSVALMTQNESIIGGCVSICSDKVSNFTKNLDCSGINCCNVPLPEDLTIFNATWKSVDDRGDTNDPLCKFSYLWGNRYKDLIKTPYISQYEDTNPISLEWNINKGVYEPILKKRYSEFNPPDTEAPADVKCHFLNSTNSKNKEQTVKCSCARGYSGNPYLPNGCQDINECLDPGFNVCHGAFGGRCRNLGGGFGCFLHDGRFCYNYDGNYICLGEKKKSADKLILLGVGVGIGMLILVIMTWWLYRVIKKRRHMMQKEKFFKRNGGLLLQKQLASGEANVDKVKMFSSKELHKATDNYNVNRMLGQGGQGTVYKGMLADGKIVAVKKSKILDESKLRQFINEVVILSQINHRNVVRLLGCCLETEVPLLVYEFIPNGTLYELIHDQTDQEFMLTWDVRLRIATEVAQALFYLHSAASIPVYHRDIKSTNILLDEKYRAKVADFGTSRTVTIDQTHVTTLVQGTFGYLDPEYFRSSQFTDKSDVYSFGVVLVELLTGERPISSTRSEEGRSLVAYFSMAMDKNCLFEIVDGQVADEGRKDEIMVVANLANKCLRLIGKERPTMKEVTIELERIQKSRKDFTAMQSFAKNEYKRKTSLEPNKEAYGSTSTESTGLISDSLLDIKPPVHTF